MARIAKVAVVVGLCASPLVIHLAFWLGWPPAVPALVVGAQLAVLCAALLARSSLPGKRVFALVIAGGLIALAWRFGSEGLTASSGIPHAAVHAALLAVFSGSLRRGQEPIVTGVIRRIRGPIPNELVRYGRQVTIAWCVYFAAQLVLSLVLFSAASLGAWSFFINVLNMPLLLLMFVAEYTYRSFRFRHLPRSRIVDMIAAIANWRAPIVSSGGKAL